MNSQPLCFLFTLVSTWAMAQNHPDTLYANQHEVLSLFFDHPIEKAVTGAPHFTFTFNRESAENLGLLQANPGPKSNLLVLTQGGDVYSYVLAYRDSLGQFVRRVDAGEKALPINTSPKEKTLVPIPEQVKEISTQMLNSKIVMHTFKMEQGLGLRVSKAFYHQGFTYLRVDLKNESAINYQLDRITLFKVLGTTARRASFQELKLEPIHVHNLPEVIPQATRARFVLVYPKFTLGPHQYLRFSIRENQGSRHFYKLLRRL
ncbi:DUF4138 domain-containing protein [Robiginitalea sp. M366]|uniref:DUF4138 domain-containing protein n=1 Tax=Robiginitalea aestuariiviva TaxID=3036903 RepID=UPI00240D353E|nr:DUF4138 domain-containing protein [Robiginitalea aestuariiviva]MDG1573297.1 DUF4138 domain-containing protein [Robiginitalea aestuariiviva]